MVVFIAHFSLPQYVVRQAVWTSLVVVLATPVRPLQTATSAHQSRATPKMKRSKFRKMLGPTFPFGVIWDHRSGHLDSQSERTRSAPPWKQKWPSTVRPLLEGQSVYSLLSGLSWTVLLQSTAGGSGHLTAALRSLNMAYNHFPFFFPQQEPCEVGGAARILIELWLAQCYQAGFMGRNGDSNLVLWIRIYCSWGTTSH